MKTPAQIRDSAISEKQLSQLVYDYARLHGWLCYRTWSSIHSPAGYPDLTLLREGRLILTELKSAKGHLTDPQIQWLGELALAGVECYLLRPADWPEVERILA